METMQTTKPWVTFEQFMAGMQELGKKMEETDRRMEETARQMEETDRQMKETDRRMQETDRQMKETDRQMKETDRRMQETDRRISKLGNRFGEMIEYMVMPNLVDKFRELHFVFTKIHHDTTIKDEKNKILAEIDFTLENGEKVMIVEVKSKPSIEDIKDHIERMGKVRLHADLHGDTRKYLGAVAGMVINDNERDFALKNGFYVIEPSGDTFTIIEPKGMYHPREW